MTKRQIEIFVANCPLCDETVRLVQELTCPSCEVSIYDLREGKDRPIYLEKAQQYGVQAVPAIAINGTLVLTGKPSREQLQTAGVGQSLS
jgi:glutaredoxin